MFDEMTYFDVDWFSRARMSQQGGIRWNTRLLVNGSTFPNQTDKNIHQIRQFGWDLATCHVNTR